MSVTRRLAERRHFRYPPNRLKASVCPCGPDWRAQWFSSYRRGWRTSGAGQAVAAPGRGDDVVRANGAEVHPVPPQIASNDALQDV